MVRTRFAPSPTGSLHVGGARTALFNYLYAKAKKGSFILRIEDTDQKRSTEKSCLEMLESMKWLGLEWDEGIEIGGDHGPYQQSERLPLYEEHINILLKEEKAYHCFCSDKELEIKKKQKEAMGIPYVYDGKCKNLTIQEVDSKLKQSQLYVIRFKIEKKEICINDIVQGEVRFDTSLIGDFIIQKSDKFPSYNFAVVVDDHLMQISNVIRGVGHLSNTPRQSLVYEAFGWEQPKWAHVSEIVGADHKKLSKRHGSTCVSVFRDMGYSSESLINYMVLLGWSPPDGKEFMGLKKIINSFDINRCSKNPAMFDVFDLSYTLQKDISDLPAYETRKYLKPKSKLNWISNLNIRNKSENEYLKEVKSFIDIKKQIDQNKLNEILLSLRVYLDYYSQINDHISDFIEEIKPHFSSECMEHISKPFFKQLIHHFEQEIKKSVDFKPEKIKEMINISGEQMKVKRKELFMSIRVATTWKTHGLELPVYLSLLGKDKVLKRINISLENA